MKINNNLSGNLLIILGILGIMFYGSILLILASIIQLFDLVLMFYVLILGIFLKKGLLYGKLYYGSFGAFIAIQGCILVYLYIASHSLSSIMSKIILWLLFVCIFVYTVYMQMHSRLFKNIN